MPSITVLQALIWEKLNVII